MSKRNKTDGDREDDIIDVMLDNMGNPESAITCPIEGCSYSDRSPKSVAAHVSSSSTAKHLWGHTRYAGWRDFVRKHGGSVD